MQLVKDDVQGSLEIVETTGDPTMRTLSRKRHVNMAPLRRLGLIRTNERPELRQSQQMVEVEEVNSQSVLIGNETRTTQGEAEETTSQSMSNYAAIQDEENLGLAQGYERYSLSFSLYYNCLIVVVCYEAINIRFQIQIFVIPYIIPLTCHIDVSIK